MSAVDEQASKRLQHPVHPDIEVEKHRTRYVLWHTSKDCIGAHSMEMTWGVIWVDGTCSHCDVQFPPYRELVVQVALAEMSGRDFSPSTLGE